MTAHPSTNQRNLADVVVVQHIGEADLSLPLGEFRDGSRPDVTRTGEGDIGLSVLDLGDVLEHHVDIDIGISDYTKDLGGVAGNVGQADHGHLGLAAVVGNSGQDGVFHRNVLN